MNTPTATPFRAVKEYLDGRFLSEAHLVEAAGLSPSDLRRVIEVGLIPGASYVLSPTGVRNEIFGAFSFTEGDSGSPMGEGMRASAYYSRVALDVLTLDAKRGKATEGDLKSQARSLLLALVSAEAPEGKWSQHHPEGPNGSAAFENYLDNAWSHWKRGTYGVCVGDLVDFRSIFCKQDAILELERLTDGGTRADFDQAGRRALRSVLAKFEANVAPFSPHERHLSSRARLYDPYKALLDSLR